MGCAYIEHMLSPDDMRLFEVKPKTKSCGFGPKRTISMPLGDLERASVNYITDS